MPGRKPFTTTVLVLLYCCSFIQLLVAQITVTAEPGLEQAVRHVQQVLEESRQKQAGIETDAPLMIHLGIDKQEGLAKEAYEIDTGNKWIRITGGDLAGALYGAYDLAEQIRMGTTPSRIQPKKHAASFAVRAIKFNLPWSAYRESKSMEYHLSTCRDLHFWEAFLDMMLDNRFNTLLLYNKHPFPFMVKVDDYPEACPFTDAELQAWQQFWRSLFAMAKARGIDVFIVNWNIVVSEGFAAKYGIKVHNDTSAVTIDYTRKSVTKLIDTYEDLAGIGVTLADWMNGQTPAQRENWIKATFLDGMRQAGRKVKFLHRAVLSGSSDEMRRILRDTVFQEPVLTEVKFNWSHGHSTPQLYITHASESGQINNGFWEPAPDNYKIQWMIRNEDFFILRWGDADFIRQHMRQNTQPYMNGYHIGSEGYIPAYEYFTRDELGRTWQYAFERQWLFYKMWGRLLYDRETPDAVFVADFEHRYGQGRGAALLQAYGLVSKMPLRLAAFFKSTWDYTLYSEGFLATMHQDRYGAGDGHSPFISIDELIAHQVLDTNYLSVRDFVSLREPLPAHKISPLQLADELLANAEQAFRLVTDLAGHSHVFNVAYNQELDDIRIWAGLSRYFGHKLQAAVQLESYRRSGNKSARDQARRLLENCLDDWTTLAAIGDRNYKRVPYWEGSVFGFKDPAINAFSWSGYTAEVQRDIELVNGQ